MTYDICHIGTKKKKQNQNKTNPISEELKGLWILCTAYSQSSVVPQLSLQATRKYFFKVAKESIYRRISVGAKWSDVAMAGRSLLQHFDTIWLTQLNGVILVLLPSNPPIGLAFPHRLTPQRKQKPTVLGQIPTVSAWPGINIYSHDVHVLWTNECVNKQTNK